MKLVLIVFWVERAIMFKKVFGAVCLVCAAEALVALSGSLNNQHGLISLPQTII